MKYNLTVDLEESSYETKESLRIKSAIKVLNDYTPEEHLTRYSLIKRELKQAALEEQERYISSIVQNMLK